MQNSMPSEDRPANAKLTSSAGAASMGSMLNIQPLTLLEVASQRTICEAAQWSRMHGASMEQPYWFFQYVQDGMLVISTPGGHAECVDPLEVSNIIPAEPVRVMAMPPCRWGDWSKRTRATSTQDALAELVAPASVIAALRDRWGRFEYRVRFDEPALNTSSSWLAPMLQSERDRLKPITKRTRMPVVSQSSASWSVTGQPKTIERQYAKACNAFFARALSVQ